MAREKQKKNIFRRFGNWFSKLSKWKKVAFITALVIVIAGACVCGYAVSKLNKIDRATIDTTKLSIVDVDGYANILLLGVDTRDMDNIDGSRSDAIMVVSINTKTKKVNLISLYRDTYLRLGDTGTFDKITHACSYGGPELTVQSINQCLDLNISNYVVVNFKAVADLVDAVGGIKVNVHDYEIGQLNKYTAQTAHNIGQKHYKLVKKPGKQKITGVQAVSYGRIRKGVGDDFKRTERMRIVLTKVFAKMKKMSLEKLDDIADMMLPQVKTTLSNSDILALSVRLPKYKIKGSTGFPYTLTSGMINGISYVVPADLAGDVAKLHQEMFKQKDYQVSATCSQISSGILANVADSKAKEEAKEKKKKEKKAEKKVQKPVKEKKKEKKKEETKKDPGKTEKEPVKEEVEPQEPAEENQE